MTVKELIDKLSAFPPDDEVMVNYFEKPTIVEWAHYSDGEDFINIVAEE